MNHTPSKQQNWTLAPFNTETQYQTLHKQQETEKQQSRKHQNRLVRRFTPFFWVCLFKYTKISIQHQTKISWIHHIPPQINVNFYPSKSRPSPHINRKPKGQKPRENQLNYNKIRKTNKERPCLTDIHGLQPFFPFTQPYLRIFAPTRFAK